MIRGAFSMRRYLKNDINVPMTFYYFYIYVKIPLTLIMYIYNLVTYGITDEFTFALTLLESLTLLCACIGLSQKKYWGYTINKILLIVEIAAYTFSAFTNIHALFYGDSITAANNIGASIANLIICPLTLVYFEKRKYLFDGYPIQNNTINTPLQTQNGAIIENPIVLPSGYSLDDDKLPYRSNRIYGWGKEFNAFITPVGDCYHKSKCPMIKGKNKTLLHRYTAMKHYKPCAYCNPKNYIDDWYLKLSSPTNITKKDILFSHTCSQCGHIFKVKYSQPENQENTLPILSVICPQCHSKEIITAVKQ